MSALPPFSTSSKKRQIKALFASVVMGLLSSMGRGHGVTHGAIGAASHPPASGLRAYTAVISSTASSIRVVQQPRGGDERCRIELPAAYHAVAQLSEKHPEIQRPRSWPRMFCTSVLACGCPRPSSLTMPGTCGQ